MRRTAKMFILNALVAGFLFSISGVCLPATSTSHPGNSKSVAMLQKVLPAIVNIRAQIKIDLQTLLRLQRERQRQGDTGGPVSVPDKIISDASGVIVDANKGYILTNAHVVDDAQSVMVTTNDGHHYKAKIIGIDKPSDIALLQIHAKNLITIPMSNSTNLKVGNRVFAIGNPFGLGQTVTSGIISALGRNTRIIENFENFIQTDAPINPGNSGGALVNAKGELIGINTAIIAPNQGSVGINLAIPSNMAKSVMSQLIQYGNVRRGMLGVGAQDITPELATAFNLTSMNGAIVTEIIPDSPAEKANLNIGDIITSINDSEIKNANDVVNAIGFLRVDSKAVIAILRDHKKLTLSAILTDPKKRQEIKQTKNPFLDGMGLQNFSAFTPVHGNVHGVAVISIDEDSNAKRSELQPGDVIDMANQKPVTSIDNLQQIAADSKDFLLLHVLRGTGAMFLRINKEEE